MEDIFNIYMIYIMEELIIHYKMVLKYQTQEKYYFYTI